MTGLKFILIYALVGISQIVCEVITLEPLHRRYWADIDFQETNIFKRTTRKLYSGCPDPAANFTLRQQEKMRWVSPGRSSHKTGVSMVINTKPGQLLINMERFSQNLASASCGEKTTLKFKSSATFDAARNSWAWVNANKQRSFILVTDPTVCKSPKSKDPWLVSHVDIDRNRKTIYLKASRRKWNQVIDKYTLDFGRLDKSLNKRLLDFSRDEAFGVDLESPWPRTLFQETIPDPKNKKSKAKIAAICDNCGTKGGLLFNGHIEGSVTGIKRFDISATPQGIEADFNVILSFDGTLDLRKSSSFKNKWDLKRIPLPYSLAIPGILTFGPNLQLGVGLALEQISGTAKVSTGVVARIPADSIAEVNFAASDVGTIRGWRPTFEVKPLKIDASISAKVLVHPIITTSVSVLVLENRGASLDLALNLPEIAVTASAGYNALGYCPKSSKPFGAKLDVSLGAALSISAWASGGKKSIFKRDINLTKITKKKVLFDKTVFSSTSLYRFPQKCIGIGDEGRCEVKPDREDQEWWDIEVESGSASLIRRHNVLVPRARSYSFPCGNAPAPFNLKSYPGPSLVRARGEAGKEVPIILPKVGCKAKEATECPVMNWNVGVQEDPNVMWAENAPGDGKVQHGWSTEHVYEGNWLKKYWTQISTKLGCSGVQNLFMIGKAGGYGDKMLWSIGNEKTYKTMMTLLPRKENILKHQMFANREFVKGYTKSNANKLACDIGRIVSTCKYMDLPTTRERLDNTILALDAILLDIDAKHPQVVEGNKFSLSAEHKKWFEGLYKDGIQHTRSRLQAYANKSQEQPDFKDLPSDMMDAIKNIAAGINWDTYCPSHFIYPKSQPQCGDIKTDPNNCGACGVKCGTGKTCKNGDCVPTQPKFPPDVVPAARPRSGWTVDFPTSIYVYQDHMLSENFFLAYGGRLTVNTRCIQVAEPPWAGDTKSIPKNSDFTFETKKEEPDGLRPPDSCCVALFDGTVCNPYAAGVKSKLICESGSYVIPFETKAWQVYNCKGVYAVRESG